MGVKINIPESVRSDLFGTPQSGKQPVETFEFTITNFHQTRDNWESSGNSLQPIDLSFVNFDEVEKELNFQMPFYSVHSRDYDRPGQTTEGLINQNANNFQQYLTLVFIPERSGVFELNTFAVWGHHTTADNFYLELVINDDQGSPEQRYRDLSIESKDTGGTSQTLNVISNGIITGNVASGTDIVNTSNPSDILNLSAGIEYTITLEWASQSGNDEAAIYRGFIEVEQKSIVKNEFI